MTENQEAVESLESQVDGLVEAYQVMLNSEVARSCDRDVRFIGLLGQLRRIEADSPRTPEILLDLLHTTLFWLAEGKDAMESPDGGRRIGGRHG